MIIKDIFLKTSIFFRHYICIIINSDLSCAYVLIYTQNILEQG